MDSCFGVVLFVVLVVVLVVVGAVVTVFLVVVVVVVFVALVGLPLHVWVGARVFGLLCRSCLWLVFAFCGVACCSWECDAHVHVCS